MELKGQHFGVIAYQPFQTDWAQIQGECDFLLALCDHLVVYLIEPLKFYKDDDRYLVGLVCEKYQSHVTIYSDCVIPDDKYHNHRYIGNWFMTHINHYSGFVWAERLVRQLKFNTDKPYRFDALLGIQRENRDFIDDRFQHCDFQDQFIYSYYKDDIRSGLWTADVKMLPCLGIDDQYTPWSYMENNGHILKIGTQMVLPVDIYNQSQYSIIAEGFLEGDGGDGHFTRFTEKTAKALVGSRLFVLFGQRYSLRALRSLGFQTFDGIIDESYDAEHDNQARWSKAWQQVEYLARADTAQIMAQCKPILRHNHKHFVRTDWHAALRQQLERLLP